MEMAVSRVRREDVLQQRRREAVDDERALLACTCHTPCRDVNGVPAANMCPEPAPQPPPPKSSPVLQCGTLYCTACYSRPQLLTSTLTSRKSLCSAISRRIRSFAAASCDTPVMNLITTPGSVFNVIQVERANCRRSRCFVLLPLSGHVCIKHACKGMLCKALVHACMLEEAPLQAHKQQPLRSVPHLHAHEKLHLHC